MRITVLTLGVLLVAAASGELSAQSAPKPVCPLLSVAEVQKVTGDQGYARPWEVGPGEGIGGGSACVYQPPETAPYGEGPPWIGFVLISGKGWTEQRKTVQLLPGCKREPVKGVGDDAFFETCPSDKPKKKVDPLYIKVGSNDLIVTMDVKAPATAESSRPTAIAFAKVVVGKVQ